MKNKNRKEFFSKTFNKKIQKQAASDTKKFIEKIKKQKLQTENILNDNYYLPQTIYGFDFVVRTNTFKCYHSEHELKDLIGVLDVRKFNGELIRKEVPAAYCEECDCYFIHKDVFDGIITIGEPLCDILESESYYKEGLYCSSNYFDYAGQSVLMEHGYNVRAYNGLTYVDRQNILADLVDKHIASSFAIRSLIKSFIAQKKYLPQYESAVEKWETDMEFITNYNSEKKERVYVSSIKRKTYKKKT